MAKPSLSALSDAKDDLSTTDGILVEISEDLFIYQTALMQDLNRVGPMMPERLSALEDKLSKARKALGDAYAGFGGRCTDCRMSVMSGAQSLILAKARMVAADEASIGVLSTGERIAVAMVLDRRGLLTWGTMLESVDRLGPEWTQAALRVQRDYDWIQP